ncbi:hypothetical protein [Calidithermus timidus]|uniref:hypothetical protein n=1 Tax=Calidithermus timidus TaxID=307124 RepID=UPI0003803E9A|nr:hypothetical protein [Calidithermus timidus]
MDHGKLHQLEAKLAHLEAERALLLARLAALEGRPRPSRKCHPASRRNQLLERLHVLLSALWLDLQEAHPQRVPEVEEALRILEGVMA